MDPARSPIDAGGRIGLCVVLDVGADGDGDGIGTSGFSRMLEASLGGSGTGGLSGGSFLPTGLSGSGMGDAPGSVAFRRSRGGANVGSFPDRMGFDGIGSSALVARTGCSPVEPAAGAVFAGGPMRAFTNSCGVIVGGTTSKA